MQISRNIATATAALAGAAASSYGVHALDAATRGHRERTNDPSLGILAAGTSVITGIAGGTVAGLVANT